MYEWFVIRKRLPVLYREPYGSNSNFSLTNVIQKPSLFYNLTRYEINTWVDYLLSPLLNKIKYHRTYEYELKEMMINLNVNHL